MNPQNVRNAEFKTVRKGLDPEEVGQFLAQVADSLEKAQNHATAMEARARAAVQRVQELSAAPPDTAREEQPAKVPDEAETISRALLLAQRTADTTVAEAESEADSLRKSAAEEATRELDAARELAAQMTETARADAEKTFAGQREAIAGEIAELKGDRDLLAADVDALEGFLAAQRERLRDAASTLVDLTERVPGGLADMAAPVLGSTTDDDTAEMPAPDTDGGSEPAADEPVGEEEPVADEPIAAPTVDDATEVLEVVDPTGDAPDDDVVAEAADAAPGEPADDLLIVTDLADEPGQEPQEGDPTPVQRPASNDDLRLNLSDES